MEQLENANFGKLDINNYIGTKVNMLTLISKSETKSKNGAYKWNCLCDCGNKVDVQPGHFVRKSLFSCGCKSHNFVDISGKRYGKWFVLGGHELRQTSKKSKSSFWKCVCDCGTFNVISANALEFGRSKSCGCARLEIDRRTHGLTDTKTYNTWDTMKQRCSNKNNTNYKHYGGRGITYDPSWESFENFYADMGERPDGTTLDRIDVNGNYNKENCRWTSRSEQSYNTRTGKNNTSGKTGVSFYSDQNKWSAEIHVNNKHIRLGMFENFEDAVKAREEAELKYYGYNVK